MSDSKKIPEGYREDARGRLVPVELISERDLMCDELVIELASAAKVASNGLAELKARAFRDIGAFTQLSAEKYDVKIGGAKGNVSLTSYDGRFKVQISVAQHTQYDERIQAAETLLLECAAEWGAGQRPEVRALLQASFQADANGKISLSRMRQLANLKIDDEKWKRGIEAVNDSLQIIGSKSYVRFFERDSQGEYQPITLDAAAV